MPWALSCLRNALLLGLSLQGVALAGPQEDARRYVNACMTLPVPYRLGCLQAAHRRLLADWGGRTAPSSSSGGSWSGRSTIGIIDGSGDCSGGSCVNILDRW